MYLIGVDIGTQGTKAALFREDLSLVATAFEPSRLVSPEPGTVWQEADDLYLSCVRTIQELVARTGIDGAKIAAIGLDGQMAGIMGVDEQGEASTYYDSWLDTRSGRYVEEMKRRAGEKITAISGGPVTYCHGSKILWWKNEHPDAYARTARFVLPHGYVAGRMTGLRGDEAFFDYTCLHFSGFGDNLNKRWSDELLDAFEVDKRKMARVVSPFDVVGRTTRAFAEISGLVEGIPVVAGCGDTSAATFGSGMFERGMTLDSAGTASVLCGVVDRYVPDVKHHTLTMMRSPIDGLWLPLAYINGGGMCIRWFRDNFTGTPHVSYDELEAEARAVTPGSEGLIFSPHFSGRILPSDPALKGSFVGLDYKHTRGHLYRSVLESIAYEYVYYLSVLRANYPNDRFEEMISIGGGAASPLFCQVKADVLGLKVHTFEMGETALLASALIAGVGVGLFNDYKAPIHAVMRRNATYGPDADNHAAYAPYAQKYLEILDATGPLYRSGIYERGAV